MLLVTYVAHPASYPIDSVCRRIMMTSCEAVKYKSSLDAFQILKNKSARPLFRGTGVNILALGLTGAGKCVYDNCMILFSLSGIIFFALALDSEPCHLNELDPRL